MESWLSPMLCATADVAPEGPDWVLEGKLDGWRAVAHVTDKGVRLYGGRNGNSYSGKLPYIEAELLRMLPPDSAVDGELVGVGWGDVQGVMTRGNGPHVPSAHVPALTYVLFDVTRRNGVDLRREPWENRRTQLEALFLPVYPHAMWKHIVLSPVGGSSQASHEAMLALGLEGSVCKRKNGIYVNGRSNNWVKIKPQETCEATIVGFKNSKVGSHVGAFVIELLDSGVRTTVKCGTQERHESATRERDGQPADPPWMNAVIEIKHHGIGDSGVPRHPMFLRRRDDRTAPAAPQRTAKKETRMSAPRQRNYAAMGDDKLLRCLDELENGGDARNRVEAKGGDVAADLEAVRQLVAARGLGG